MPDTRPLEERFDITYVRAVRWPELMNRCLMWVVVLAGGGALALLSVRGDHRLYSSGELNVVHASFGNDCAQCHQPAPGAGTNYFMPVSDQACLRCHAAAEHAAGQSAFSADLDVLIPGHAGPVRMAARCAECHVEHRGAQSNLNLVSDRVCLQCHSDLGVRGYSRGVDRAGAASNREGAP